VRIVGTALLFEEGGHAAYDEGAWVTAPGAKRLNVPDPEWSYIFVDARPGTDIDALDKRIAAAGGERDGHWPGVSVAAIDNLKAVRKLPSYLAIFLALLGAGALAHTLISTVRRRRHDLAVLRALGLTRRGTRAVIAWQATTVGVIAVVLGLPLGILLGRLVWHVIATSMPIVDVAPGIGLATLLVAPATLLLVNVVALWPAWAGGRASPAVALRAE
jgi:ribosomal protein L30/L7E